MKKTFISIFCIVITLSYSCSWVGYVGLDKDPPLTQSRASGLDPQGHLKSMECWSIGHRFNFFRCHISPFAQSAPFFIRGRLQSKGANLAPQLRWDLEMLGEPAYLFVGDWTTPNDEGFSDQRNSMPPNLVSGSLYRTLTGHPRYLMRRNVALHIDSLLQINPSILKKMTCYPFCYFAIKEGPSVWAVPIHSTHQFPSPGDGFRLIEGISQNLDDSLAKGAIVGLRPHPMDPIFELAWASIYGQESLDGEVKALLRRR